MKKGFQRLIFFSYKFVVSFTSSVLLFWFVLPNFYSTFVNIMHGINICFIQQIRSCLHLFEVKMGTIGS
jgi:hypothetical protein